MKRVMCMHLPAWPIERLWHERPELRGRPIVLYDPHAARGPQVVTCLSARRSEARRPNRNKMGTPVSAIRPGMPLAEALAIEPHLHVEPYDPRADLQALGRLAEWAGRFSPLVAIDGAGQGAAGRESETKRQQPLACNIQRSTLNYSLLLDITGCAACFGGEEKLLARAVRELHGAGWSARLAIADTVGGAWGLAHYGNSPCLVSPGQTEAAVLPLPVAALRLPHEMVQCLIELGIERISDLAVLPRSSLPARFGPRILEQLDQAFGRLSEVLVPYRPPGEIEAAFLFEYATDHRDLIGYALDRLTGQVCQILRERNTGARKIECWLKHEVAKPLRLEIGLYRPNRSPVHLRRLLRARFERVRIEEPVCAISLRVPLSAPLDEDPGEIFEIESPRDPSSLSRLLDELSAQLGRDAVTRPRLLADAQAEHACCYEPVLASGEGQKAESQPRDRERRGKHEEIALTPSALRSRPLRLWAEPVLIPTTSVAPDGPPARFRWAGVEHRVVGWWGPERIETGWWRGQDVHRDYYMVETTSGARFWIYRRLDDGKWFLHGCFD